MSINESDYMVEFYDMAVDFYFKCGDLWAEAVFSDENIYLVSEWLAREYRQLINDTMNLLGVRLCDKNRKSLRINYISLINQIQNRNMNILARLDGRAAAARDICLEHGIYLDRLDGWGGLSNNVGGDIYVVRTNPPDLRLSFFARVRVGRCLGVLEEFRRYTSYQWAAWTMEREAFRRTTHKDDCR